MAKSQEQNSVLTWIIGGIGENLLNKPAPQWGLSKFLHFSTHLRGGVVGAGPVSRSIIILGKSGSKGLPKHKAYEKLFKIVAGVLFNVFC